MRVAIVNDSRVAAEALRRVVLSDPRHAIAWTASDGAEAVRRCELDPPDVVLMDLVMPAMNGAEATRQIMQRKPVPVLVVTATVAGNFDLVCEAMGHGAFDAVATPVLGSANPADAGAAVLARLEAVARVGRHLSAVVRPAPVLPPGRTCVAPPTFPLVALGASTGGPMALEAILSRWPAGFPGAVLVVQHIAAEFAPSMVQWLGQRCKLAVRLAVPGDRPTAGTVLVAGQDNHLILQHDGVLNYTTEPTDCPYRPSVDALFHSLAANWSAPGIAVLLTGIGQDGAAGLLQLKQAGWHTIAQDRATSTVYGMPQAAAQMGAASCVLPLGEIAGQVAEALRSGRR
jgi:two-component system response regulator WspF